MLSCRMPLQVPYNLIEPVSAPTPLIVDSPHSGRVYPDDFAYSCPLSRLRQAEDTFVDELAASAAAAGAAVLIAEFPRSLIDVNRAETDIDPAALDGVWPHPASPDALTLAGYGLVRRLCSAGLPIYDRPLTVSEIQRRLDAYYLPYHACLRQQIELKQAQFGACLLLDMHSMPDRVEDGLSRPDFILGDRDGSSSDPGLTRRLQRLLQDMGYRVILNHPYKGREIVKRYGRTGLGAEAVQIEINRRLYMHEGEFEKNAGFASLRKDLAAFFQAVAMMMSPFGQEALAAE